MELSEEGRTDRAERSDRPFGRAGRWTLVSPAAVFASAAPGWCSPWRCCRGCRPGAPTPLDPHKAAVALAPALLERPASSELAALFRGLAEPARPAILRRLVDAGPQTVSELVAACRQRQPSVSKHLACLHECGLVARERRGRRVVYAALAPEVPPLLAAAERLWEIARCGESCACSCCQEGR